MKCLLVFLVLFQSVNRFVQLHHRSSDVKSTQIQHNESASNDTPNIIENDFKHESSMNNSIETENEDSIDTGTEQVDTSETLNNRERVQDEIINETTTGDSTRSEALFESSKLYDQHSKDVFPRICMDGMTGSMIDIVGNFIPSFSKLHSVLSGSIERESSAVLFNIVDALAKITGSTSSVLSSLSKALPEAFQSITKVVSGLNVQTLAPATELPGTISELEKFLTTTIKIVNEAQKLKSHFEEKLNTATALVATSLQEIVNTLHVIAEATTKAIGSVSTKVQEAVISLTLVLATVCVIVQSIYVSIACVLPQPQSVNLDTVLAYLDSTLKSIIGVITTAADNSAQGKMSVVIGGISKTLTYLANEVNPTLNSIIESSAQLDFFHSLEELLDQLSQVVGNMISCSVSNSIELVTSSLNLASASSYNMLAKVSHQISLVYVGLSRVIGTDILILKILIHSFRSIFKTISSALNYLQSGIGLEATEALEKFTENVHLSLKSLISLISGSTEGYANIPMITKEIGKSIQHIVSAFDSIASTISGSISEVNVAVVEAVLCLPLICSAVLYVAQWVLSAAVSVFNSLVGSVSDDLLNLTIPISVTLDTVSRISSTICSSLSDSLKNIFHSIMPLIKDLGQQIISSYAPISGSVFNIVFNLDALLLGSVKSVANQLHSAKGNVPQILNSLTGKLNSISPELSSTLLSLNNSLTTCSTSDSTALKVISNNLILLVAKVTQVTGSAYDIVLLISNVLSGVFKNLSIDLSKFSLGDVSVSLNESVSNIYNALRSLIETINVCTTDLNILVEPIRNVAKTIQILISTFFAVFDAISQANKDVAKKMSDVIMNLPFIVSTVCLVIQYVLGAAIAKLLVIFEYVPTVLQELGLALSTILQRITSITGRIAVAQLVNHSEIIGQILASVSDLNDLASSSLSVISLVLPKIIVSLDAV